MRLLFSIAVHESNLSVRSLIKNIQKFTLDPILLFHISADFLDFDLELEKYHNVYFNDVRLKTGYLDGSLLRAHVLNMGYAESNEITYDYFIPFGSNQMLIKTGIEGFILKNGFKKCNVLLPISYVNILILFDWKNLLNLVIKYDIKCFYKASPEGTYWPRDMVQENLDDLNNYCDQITSKGLVGGRLVKLRRLVSSFKGNVVYPLEELILPTFLLRYTKEASGTDYCFKDWKNDLQVPIDRIDQIKQNYYSVKRVDRNDNMLRRLIDGMDS